MLAVASCANLDLCWRRTSHVVALILLMAAQLVCSHTVLRMCNFVVNVDGLDPLVLGMSPLRLLPTCVLMVPRGRSRPLISRIGPARWGLMLAAPSPRLDGRPGCHRFLPLPTGHTLPPRRRVDGNRDRWQYHCETCQHGLHASDFRSRPCYVAAGTCSGNDLEYQARMPAWTRTLRRLWNSVRADTAASARDLRGLTKRRRRALPTADWC
jgi:hypothetical protein